MADEPRILIGGAFAVSPYGVLPVFGWEIKLDPTEHDIEEAAIVTNLNFHCGRQRAVLDVEHLPGPTSLTV